MYRVVHQKPFPSLKRGHLQYHGWCLFPHRSRVAFPAAGRSIIYRLGASARCCLVKLLARFASFFILRLPTTVRISLETCTRAEVGPYKEHQLTPGFTQQSRAREGSRNTIDSIHILSQAKTLNPTRVNRNNARTFPASGRLLPPGAGRILLRDRHHRETEKLGRGMY